MEEIANKTRLAACCALASFQQSSIFFPDNSKILFGPCCPVWVQVDHDKSSFTQHKKRDRDHIHPLQAVPTQASQLGDSLATRTCPILQAFRHQFRGRLLPELLSSALLQLSKMEGPAQQRWSARALPSHSLTRLVRSGDAGGFSADVIQRRKNGTSGPMGGKKGRPRRKKVKKIARANAAGKKQKAFDLQLKQYLQNVVLSLLEHLKVWDVQVCLPSIAHHIWCLIELFLAERRRIGLLPVSPLLPSHNDAVPAGPEVSRVDVLVPFPADRIENAYQSLLNGLQALSGDSSSAAMAEEVSGLLKQHSTPREMDDAWLRMEDPFSSRPRLRSNPVPVGGSKQFSPT